MDLDKLNARLIATDCSERHIQSVIEDLVKLAKIGHQLAKEVDSLNSLCNEIGDGKMATMKSYAKRFMEELK